MRRSIPSHLISFQVVFEQLVKPAPPKVNDYFLLNRTSYVFDMVSATL